MILGDNDITIGRMPVGGAGDPSEFDAMPMNRIWETESRQEGESGDELDMLSGDIDPEPFESPEEESQFPIFKSAYEHFQASEPQSRAVRIDNEKTYGHFVSEQAVKEIERRLNEVRAALEEHSSDHHGGKMAQMRKWDEILGAAEAVSDLSKSETAHEAADKMPKVPLDLPPFAEGKIKCWRDGEYVVCSIRFGTVGGAVRIATMAAKPSYDAESVAGWAARAGVNPITILGVLPDIADVACGKKLVKEVAGAALAAQRRLDVCGMDGDDEPVVIPNTADTAAPVAALMYVEQQADAGDPQAVHELTEIRKAAVASAAGRDIVAPVLAASSAKLAVGRLKAGERRRAARTWAERYADQTDYLL